MSDFLIHMLYLCVEMKMKNIDKKNYLFLPSARCCLSGKLGYDVDMHVQFRIWPASLQ